MCSTSETRDIARRFIRAWNAGNLHIVDELAAPTLTVAYSHFPEAIDGPDAFKKILARTHKHFPDLAVEVGAIVAEEDEAAVEWTYRGTFQTR